MQLRECLDLDASASQMKESANLISLSLISENVFSSEEKSIERK